MDSGVNILRPCRVAWWLPTGSATTQLVRGSMSGGVAVTRLLTDAMTQPAPKFATTERKGYIYVHGVLPKLDENYS